MFQIGFFFIRWFFFVRPAMFGPYNCSVNLAEIGFERGSLSQRTDDVDGKKKSLPSSEQLPDIRRGCCESLLAWSEE